MVSKRYSKAFKIQVAEEALRPENERAAEILAVKYGIQPRTVAKWKNMYRDQGPDAFSRSRQTKATDKYTAGLLKENERLKEENEILKKAAAFLADLRRQ